MVDIHVEELRSQLKGKSRSVIDWIQGMFSPNSYLCIGLTFIAWNSYAATFFSSNFGKASNCFGREHVDNMLATHRHIQESIFDSGNVVQHLKQMITDRFNVSDVPDGFLFYPVELGGLDLKSPFVGLLQIRESVQENPYDLVAEFQDKELEDYNAVKRNFDRGELRNARHGLDPSFIPKDADTFMAFEEFARYRETLLGAGRSDLKSTYLELLKRPTELPIDASVQVRQALEQLQGQSNLRGITPNWNTMDAYWKWVRTSVDDCMWIEQALISHTQVAQLYGPELMLRFAGMNIVDPGLLPIGMVGFFRQRRTKWQG